MLPLDGHAAMMGRQVASQWESPMTKHMPAVPVANRSDKGPGDSPETARDETHQKKLEPQNTSEQGETANIRQNTTNKGYFRGRRMK